MNYTHPDVQAVAELLKERLQQADEPRSVLRARELKGLYGRIPTLGAEERSHFGQQVNMLKGELEALIAERDQKTAASTAIDVTAPFDVNVSHDQRPRLLSAEHGSMHPITQEMECIIDIFTRMGFDAVYSRQLDDDYHMFGSLNFPEGHPARDDYDTFMTDEGLIAPAHTSTMQNRILKSHGKNLENGQPIQVVIPGRTFRNEDVDARHEHTFHQIEGVYVGKNVTVGNLIATLKTFLEAYYHQALEVKTQQFYFPFTEPSFEFALSCPFCKKKGCSICSQEGWIELLGCGMIHPNVLEEGGIDPSVYTGFAWGCGVERLVMMKYNIEDIRLFNSGRLAFLRQFSSGGAT